tara:strand:- start:20 stop:286 length:267 start_codon:yes stop_codon:yes gene_type:complete
MIVYLGKGFGKGEGRGKSLTPNVDENGKVYFRFCLIADGEHKGMYKPVATFNFFATRGQYRDVTAEAEMRDIIESGFEIYAPDPKSLR